MKTKKDILQKLITDFTNEQNEVTYLGKPGSARALLNAIAGLAFEMWNDIYQFIRRIWATTSTGTDLDDVGTRKGLTRKAVAKSSAVAIFNGPAGTVILTGTIIKSSISGVQYQTKTDITLGANNPNLPRPIFSNALGDFAIVESLLAGSSTKVSAGELTVFATPITGVTVTNLVPSAGGEDAETDDQFRDRIIKQVDILNQGTNDFYASLAKGANSDILLALPIANPSNGGVNIYVAKNSLALFTSEELTAIANYIYSKQRALNTILCYNAIYKSVEISCSIRIRPGSSFNTIYTLIATKISDYINLERMGFGANIGYYKMLEIITDVPDVIDIDANLLLLNGITDDIQCANNELPKFSYLSVKDQTNLKAEDVQQVYQIL